MHCLDLEEKFNFSSSAHKKQKTSEATNKSGVLWLSLQMNMNDFMIINFLT